MSMSSLSVELRGAQEPRVHSVPEFVTTAGDEAIELAASAGLFLDPWQELVLRDSLGERADGRWAAFEVGLIVPRQNGKGSILEARELAGLFLFGEKKIIHSAHEFKTAVEAYERVAGLIRNTPALDKRVRNYYNSNEKTAIVLKNGQVLRFMARNKNAGRGFTGDVIILDEAYALTDGMIGALMPTMSARAKTGNPQMWYTSSAGMFNSNALRRIRDRGEEGTSGRLAYFDWSAPKGADPDDPKMWALANPGLGIRLTEEFTRLERESMDLDEFMRERMGIWDDPSANAVIDPDRWAALADPTSQMFGDKVCLAIDVQPDGKHASLAVAGRQAVKRNGSVVAGGKIQAELIAHEAGTEWVVERVKQFIEDWGPLEVVLDPKGSPGVLLPAFEAEGVEITRLSLEEHEQACALFEQLVMGARLESGVVDVNAPKRFVHLNSTELNAAMAVAAKREIGDGGQWLWKRKGVADISPVVAVTQAVFSFVRSEKRRPVQKSSISHVMYGFN